MIAGTAFSVMTVADLFQLHSVTYLLGLRFWYLFEYSEFVEVVR